MIDETRIDAQIENFKSDAVNIELIDEDFLIECLVELKHHHKFITPRKPKITIHNCYCPNCDYPFGRERIMYEATRNFNYFKYCTICGQCLDWSEVKE